MAQHSNSKSELPVVQQLGLSDRNDWLGELARWYEADWKLALLGEKKPQSDLFIQVLDEARRAEALSVLSSINDFYQRQLSTKANYDADLATVYQPALSASQVDASKDQTTRILKPETSRTAIAGGDVTLDCDDIALVKRSILEVDQPATSAEKAHQQLERDRTLEFRVDKQFDPEATFAFHADATEKDQIDDQFASNDSLNFSVGDKKVSGNRVREKLPTIPGYQIKGVLGRGGMGIVYLAEQHGIKRNVALKMVLAGGHASHEVRERFQAEARAVGRFQHENIVRIYDIGEYDGLPYFSLEYIDGPSLSSKIDGKPMDPRESAQVLEPLARGLAFAHESGVTHRDLKPGNILLTKDGVPKLSDFGLAKQDEGGYDLSRTGDIVGTPSYMAPEQALGESTVGPLSDIYSLGAVLYCMLTGRPPFLANKPTDTLIQLLHEEPIEPMKLVPSIDKDLDTICLKCLQKEPQKRYANAMEFADDLRRYLEGEPISARPISRIERVVRYSKRKPRQAALIATAAGLAGILAIGGPLAAGAIYKEKQAAVAAKLESESNAILAAKSEKEAKYQAAIAEQNAEKAVASEKVAVENEMVAMEQQKHAIDALKSLVFQVQRETSDDPRLLLLRQKLIAVATDGLARMDRVGIDEVARSSIQAGIERRLGDVNMELGRVDQAISNFKACLALLQSLDQQGKLTGKRHNYSTCYDLLGDAYRNKGNFTLANDYYQLALEQRRAWQTEEPGNEAVEQNVAASLGKLGFIMQDRGLLDKASEYFKESSLIREKFFNDHPMDLAAKLEMLGTNWSIASLNFQMDASEEASAMMQNVVAELGKIAEANPYIVSLQEKQVVALNDLAMMFVFRKNFDLALVQLDLADKVLSGLAADIEHSLRFKELVAKTAFQHGVCYEGLGNRDKANESFTESLKLRESMLEIDVENPMRQLDVAIVAARSDQVTRALELLKAVESKELDTTMKYYIACSYAQIVASIERGTATAPQSLDEIRQLGLKRLEESIQGGFHRSTDLKLDPDLEPLRNMPTFASLISD